MWSKAVPSRVLPFLAVIALLLPAFAAAQITVVQATNNPIPTNPSSLATVTVAYPNTETAGNLNVVVIGWSDTSSAVTDVHDSAGNPYHLAAGTTRTTGGTGVSQDIYYAENIKAGANTVTVTFNQAANTPDVRIAELSGAATSGVLDMTSGNFGSSTTADSGSATTNSDAGLIFGAGTTKTGFTGAGTCGSNTFTAASGYPNAFGDIVEYFSPATVSTSYSTCAPLSPSGEWVIQMVGLRVSGQGSTAGAAPTITNLSATSGFANGGTDVIITGTNIRDGAVALFDTSPGVNCMVTPTTSIDCLTPPHAAGTVNVVVQNLDGTTSSPASFTYNPFSQPTITSVSPAGGSTNGGTQITISGSNFTTGATVSVQETINGTLVSLPASNVNVSATSIKANVPAGMAAAADIVVISPNSLKAKATGAYTYSLGTTGINFVQVGTNASANTLQTVPVAMPINQTAGNLNVVIIGWNDATSTITKVADSAGNSYTAALPVTTNSSGLSQTIYYGELTKGGSNTVTVTFSGPVFAPDVRVLEYSGLDPKSPLDNANGASGSGTLANSGPTATTHAFDVLVGAATVKNAVTDAGQGYTTTTITASGDNAEHQIINATGSYNTTAPIPKGGAWVMQVAAFKAAATTPTAGDFTLSASGAQTVNAGSSAQYTITVTPQNGFSSTVNLSVTCPANVQITCSISPNAVTPGTTLVTATLTVTTTGPTAALYTPQSKRLLPLYAIFLPLPGIALAGAGLAGSRRRKLGIGGAVVLGFLLLLLLVGCGGGSSNGGGGGGNAGTPPGTYNITVTASSGSLSHTATAVVTVQ